MQCMHSYISQAMDKFHWGLTDSGFEMKYGDAPTMTKSLHVAMQDLKLDHAYIVYPGTRVYPITNKVTVIPLPDLRLRLRER